MRLFAVLVGLSCAFIIVAVFAGRASLSGSSAQIAAMIGDPNARAKIVDRHGQLLAADVNVYNLFVDPSDMTAADRPFVQMALSRIFPNLTGEQIDKAFKPGVRMLLTGNLTAAMRDRILNYGLPGVSFEPLHVRDYPLGVTGASYIGMTKRFGEGMSGAELALQNQIVSGAIHDEPVQVAMDLRVQGVLENELRVVAQEKHAQAAVGIITNVRTGEVLAMASWPDFDLNHPGAYSDAIKRNHAAVDRYEVGSIFKVISIASGLDTGTASLNSNYDVSEPLQIGNRQVRDMHSKHPVMTLEDVFIQSSNIGTSRVALNAGIGPMTGYYKALGLFRSADIELAESASPLLPRQWTDEAVASSAFGQGMAITPLSYAEAAGAVLNGGCLRRLTIKKYDSRTPLACDRVFSVVTSREMLDLMRSNVLKGTGGRANVPGLRVGGKTGSAQKPSANGGYDPTALISSFAAVFPTDGPMDGDRYLVQIMFDSPKGNNLNGGQCLGGVVAAPVAGRVIHRIAPFLGVERKEDKVGTEVTDQSPESDGC